MDNRYNYFGGARNIGFAQLRNVSKLHPEAPKLLPNAPKLLRGNEIIITEK